MADKIVQLTDKNGDNIFPVSVTNGIEPQTGLLPNDGGTSATVPGTFTYTQVGTTTTFNVTDGATYLVLGEQGYWNIRNQNLSVSTSMRVTSGNNTVDSSFWVAEAPTVNSNQGAFYASVITADGNTLTVARGVWSAAQATVNFSAMRITLLKLSGSI